MTPARLIDGDTLIEAVAEHLLARLPGARAGLRSAGLSSHAQLLGDAIPALRDAAPTTLFRSALRSWVAAFEQARELSRLARTARGRSSESAPVAALFDAVAATPHLLSVAPRHVSDPGFVARAAELAATLGAEAAAELPLVLATLPSGHSRPTRYRVPATAAPEIACAPGERPLGTSAHMLIDARPGRSWIELGDAVLHIGRGQRRLMTVDRYHPSATFGDDLRIDARPRLGAGPTRLGRSVRSLPDRLVVAELILAQGERLADALAVLHRAWVDGWRDVGRFTEVVVPLDEPGTVSYSHLDRPGYSFINVFEKSTSELVDDLVHETAHHELHALEELGLLVDDDGEPRWWSPWRRAFRPLRGIVHATYTFTRGAQLFTQLARPFGAGADVAMRRYANRRLIEETTDLAFSLSDLKRADRRRQLTSVGHELLAELKSVFERELRPQAEIARHRLQHDGASGERIIRAIDVRARELDRARELRPGSTL